MRRKYSTTQPKANGEVTNAPAHPVSEAGELQQVSVKPPNWSWRAWIVVWLICLGILSSVFMEVGESLGLGSSIAIVISGSAFAATFYYGLYYSFQRVVFNLAGARSRSVSLIHRAEQLQDELEVDFFTNLVKINFKYIEKYYLQTQIQGDKSFLICVCASITGLIIIISGIVMMLLDKTTPAYVTTASGVLAEFIAAVFFYLYHQTVIKMAEYHQKLVITQNISLALKITEGLGQEERDQAQREIIRALVKDVNLLLANQIVPAAKETGHD